MNNDSRQTYRPGFWCCFFWVLTWLGIFGGLALMWVLPPECAGAFATLCWVGAAIFAVISTMLRNREKNRFDGKKSLHWFD